MCIPQARGITSMPRALLSAENISRMADPAIRGWELEIRSPVRIHVKLYIETQVASRAWVSSRILGLPAIGTGTARTGGLIYLSAVWHRTGPWTESRDFFFKHNADPALPWHNIMEEFIVTVSSNKDYCLVSKHPMRNYSFFPPNDA